MLKEKLEVQERLKSVEAAVARLMEELEATHAKARAAEATRRNCRLPMWPARVAADALHLDEHGHAPPDDRRRC